MEQNHPKKVLYVATVVKTHIMEFHIPYLKMLKEMGWETAVAARNDYENPQDCKIPYCDTYYDIPFERNPFKPGNLKAYKQLMRVINEGHYDIIHCHTPVGGMLTRLAAKKARKQGSKVFYTAHGFHFYKGAPLLNWVLYYPVEKWLARKTDDLLTINSEDYGRAKSFRAKHSEYIPGVGIDIQRYRLISSLEMGVDTRKHMEILRKELCIPLDAKVILSVGEINRNKNHRIVLEALPELHNCWFILCGRGPLMEEYRRLAEKLGVSDRFIMTGYRTDLVDFYHMADVFVFPSIREGLGLALMEAMASDCPCVASRNRGTNDLLSDSKLRFDSDNKEELVDKLEKALYENQSEEIHRNSIVLKKYDLTNALFIMKSFYLREVGE